MNKPLFMHIVDRLSNEVQFFRQKKEVRAAIRACFWSQARFAVIKNPTFLGIKSKLERYESMYDTP